MLADEPVAGLDPAHQLDVMALLKQRAAAGQGIAVVLHDLALAARFCSRLVMLREGRVIAEGTPVEVLTADGLARGYGVRAFIEERDGGLMVVPTERIESDEDGRRA
jgi:iron complex transport system ATP-binding protein